MTTREAILLALAALLKSDPFFPEPDLDAPEPRNWRTPVPGAKSALQDCVTVQDGDVSVTRDGGAEDSWELQLDAAIVYVVQGVDRRERRRRRDQAGEHIAALIAGNRSLGLEDPQIYAEIAEGPDRDDEVPVKAAAPVALIRVPIAIQFIASSPAE